MNTHGGKRQGAGRKPKAEEQEIIEKLDLLIKSDEAIKILKDLIKDRNFNAIKLYLEYRFGKPKETVHNKHEFHNTLESIRELYGRALD